MKFSIMTTKNIIEIAGLSQNHEEALLNFAAEA